MELSKKTTIVLSPEFYERLFCLARQKGVSLAEPVRSACEKRQYGLVSSEDRLDAVRSLAALALPVGEVNSLEAICSYDRDFDRVQTIRRTEPV